jgi:AraC-like DNA-binding protein
MLPGRDDGVGGSGARPPHQPFAPIHITTADFPEAKRLTMWREVYGRNIARFDIEPLDDSPFHADVTFRALPGLNIASGSRSDAAYRMTRELAATANDNLIFALVRSGVGIVSQFDREVTVTAGGGVLLSGSDPSVCTLRSSGRFLTLAIPHDTLRPLITDRDSALVRSISQHTEALRLLSRYLSILEEPTALTSAELASRVVAHIIDLTALAIGPTRAATEVARGRGLRAARLNAVKADIGRFLTNEGMTAQDLAARHGLTTRYVHMLFETEDKTFSEYVVEQRLALAYRLLVDARLADRTISSIAFQVGFSNLSHFNRVFRRRYERTPSDVREAARREWDR